MHDLVASKEYMAPLEMHALIFKNCQAILVDDLIATKEDLVSAENYSPAF